MSKRVNNITIEGAKVIFRDFTGTYDKKYNPTCQRKFGVLLEDEELVEQLKADGWNVKTLSSNDEYESDAYYLTILQPHVSLKDLRKLSSTRIQSGSWIMLLLVMWI